MGDTPSLSLSPFPSLCGAFTKKRDGLPESSQAGLDFRVIRGDVDLSGSFPAFKLCQHFCLSLADMIFQVKDFTWPQNKPMMLNQTELWPD